MQKVYTKIESIVGNVVTVRASGVRSGDLALVGESYASVIKLSGDLVSLQVFAGTQGVSTTDTVRFLGRPMMVSFSDDLLGRVFDGAGVPRDNGPALTENMIPIGGPSVNPAKRIVPKRMIRTGIPMIDVFNTLVESQKLPIFSVSGEPYNQLLARIAILAVTWIVCFAVCTWCLRHERLTIGANSPSETAKGIGAFAWMPDSTSGAVSARLITYLKRDPRQAMTFAMPVLFLIIFAFQAHGISAVVWQSLIWCGWFMSVVESNGLAYDGRGFTMEVIAGVRGRTDRIGRVRVYVGIMVVYMVLLYLAGIVLVGALTGRWAQPDDLATGLIFLATGMGIALSGLGVAEVTSCVLMYPVASMDKPFSAPQGRAMAQGFFPFVYMLGSLLLMLPTGIVALVMLLTGAEGGMWLAIIPVALANGIGILALGTWLGGKLMDARMLSIVATLDSFASLQK